MAYCVQHFWFSENLSLRMLTAQCWLSEINTDSGVDGDDVGCCCGVVAVALAAWGLGDF